MAQTKIFLGFLFIPATALLLGCKDRPERPELLTEADSLAWQITEAYGGLDAWEALPILRFDYVEGTDSSESFRALHLWDRRNDRYRVEWSLDQDSLRDSVVVALFRPSNFDPENPQGSAVIGDVRFQENELDEILRDAYYRFVNDSYWLLAPFKLFDSNVNRALTPDSSTANRVALALSFDSTSPGPGDRYWIYADRASATLQGWTFYTNESDPPASFVWTDPAQIAVGNDTLTFPITKHSPDGTVIRTPVGPPGDAGALLTDLSNRLLPLD